ncbi:unnamed protein product, partial [Didymodactylos carnosus]
MSFGRIANLNLSAVKDDRGYSSTSCRSNSPGAEHSEKMIMKKEKQLESYRGDKDETFPDTVIFHDQNLIQIRGKDYGDYARKVLRVLFTKEELTTSVLPPGAPYLRHDPLDETRFELLP